MNSAPTKATVSDHDSAFLDGANQSVNRATSGSGAGQSPETIAERKKNRFKGSTNQPMRTGGPRYKFLDAAENHPRIPKSRQSEFTQEIDAIPTAQSGDPTRISGLNKTV